MQTHDKHRNFLIHFAYWASVTIIILAFLYFLLKPLVPFIIAFSVAAVLQPVMRWCQKRWKIAEGVLAAGLTVLCYTLLVGLVLLLLIGLFTALIDWASGLPELFTGTVSPWIEKSSSDALSFLSRLDPQMGAYVQDMLPEYLHFVRSLLQYFLQNMYTVVYMYDYKYVYLLHVYVLDICDLLHGKILFRYIYLLQVLQ